MKDPFDSLTAVPEFYLTSTDIADGDPLPLAQRSHYFSSEGGEDISPQLSWSGAPSSTRSFAVTMFGADAPTLSGFWHWAVVNIPAHITSLARGAGDDAGEAVPRGAKQLPNDLRAARYVGANPQAGFREFRYFFIVWALNLKRIDLPSYATPAYFQLQTDGHVVGRATLVANASDAPGSSRNAAYWGHT